MLKVGQIEEVEITGYSSEGMGVCRMEGCAVFVPNAIRGERCTVKITHVSRNSAHGKIEEILVRSPHRVRRACPDAKLCGGCQLHHMDYAEELAFKAQKVTDALTRIGGQSLFCAEAADPGRRTQEEGVCGTFDSGCASPQDDPVGAFIGRPPEASIPTGTANAQPSETAYSSRTVPITGAIEIHDYRNKAQYPLAMKNGKPIAGFYKNRTHEVVPVKRCAILPAVFDQVKDVVLRWAEEDRVSVYDEQTGKGLLRHLYVRKGAVSGQIMVCIVANGRQLPRENRLIHALRREIPGLASVILSVNEKNTNVVLGDEFRTLWGRDWIEDRLCGFSFRLSPRSFYQVNHDQAQRLYEKAVELAELHGTETVLDLYCGTGTITLALSRKAGRTIGVEIVPQAIEDAKENAARNGVTNVEFYCADASEASKRFAAQATGSGQQATEEHTVGAYAHIGPAGSDDAAGSGQQATGEHTVGANAHIGPAGPDDAAGSGQQATEERGGRILRFAQNDRTGTVDVIVVDPPRKGLAPDVIEAMVRMAPQRIVYVSCDPATLARDIKCFSQQGYTLTHAEAFDLFPRTFHVECVTLMTKK